MEKGEEESQAFKVVQEIDRDTISGIVIEPSFLPLHLIPSQVCVAQVPGPNALTDFIAAYAPADADLHATAPVKVRREGGRE